MYIPQGSSVGFCMTSVDAMHILNVEDQINVKDEKIEL